LKTTSKLESQPLSGNKARSIPL